MKVLEGRSTSQPSLCPERTLAAPGRALGAAGWGNCALQPTLQHRLVSGELQAVGTYLCNPGAAFTETCCPASWKGNSSCSPVCLGKDEHGRQGSVCSGLTDGREGLYGPGSTGRALSISTGLVSVLEILWQWLPGLRAVRGFPGCTQWCLQGVTDVFLLVGCSNTRL